MPLPLNSGTLGWFARRSAPFIVLLILSSGVLLAGQQARPASSKTEEEFARGVQLQQQGDLDGARRAYEAALKVAPRRVEALSNLGMVYAQLGQYEMATQQLKRAVALAPSEMGVRLNLAVVYMQAGDFGPASQELAEVVTRQPTNYRAHHLLGLCLLKLNDVQKGIAELEVVCKAEPGNLDAAYTLASSYISGGQVEKAAPIVESLSRYDTAEAHLITGSYYLAILEYRKALKELTRAKELNPRLPDLHSQLGYANIFVGNHETAMQMFETELAMNPQDTNSIALLGSLYRQFGRLEEAADLLNKAHQMRPMDLDIVFQMGLLAQSKGAMDEALKLLQGVAEKRPDDPPTHIALVKLYARLKRPDDVKREQVIVDRLNAERRNQPTVKDRALFEVATKPLE
jgi:Flp pilus assembly protein TadD